MSSLAAERSDMAREFVFFAEKKREENGGSLVGAFENASAAVIHHCRSRYNRISCLLNGFLRNSIAWVLPSLCNRYIISIPKLYRALSTTKLP